jgi:type IV pilus assembly protein PilQ
MDKPVSKRRLVFGVFVLHSVFTAISPVCAMPSRLTVNLVDAPLRSVLKLIGDASGFNLVAADTVQGSLTMRLRDVPWAEALQLIARMHQLAIVTEGDVLWVAPLADVHAYEEARASARERGDDTADLHLTAIPLSFGSAADIATLLTRGATGPNGGSSFLSAHGSALADTRSNTLLLHETAAKLAQLRPLLAHLDRAVRQVQIQARIVVASESFRRSLGVRWGVHANGIRDQRGSVLSPSEQARADAVSGTKKDGGNDHYNINLPAHEPAGSLGFAIIGANFLTQLELSAAQVNGQVRTLSSPRVVVSNHTEASIRQGKQVGYRPPSAGDSAATVTQFKDVDLLLRVTPSIAADGKVQLRIAMTDDTVADLRKTVGVPQITKNELTTTVLVDHGQTVVVGGIRSTDLAQGSTRVPGLGAVPVLGRLFRNSNRTRRKEELLLFITPTILEP